MGIAELVFYIGAGIMCLPFLAFGCTDYHVISIITCLILCPILSNLSLLVSVFTTRFKVFRIINSVLFTLSLVVSYLIMSYYHIPTWIAGDISTMEVFSKCENDLQLLSLIIPLWVPIDMDYFLVNVLIYMVIFPCILLYPLLVFVLDKLIRKFKRTPIK